MDKLNPYRSDRLYTLRFAASTVDCMALLPPGQKVAYTRRDAATVPAQCRMRVPIANDPWLGCEIGPGSGALAMFQIRPQYVDIDRRAQNDASVLPFLVTIGVRSPDQQIVFQCNLKSASTGPLLLIESDASNCSAAELESKTDDMNASDSDSKTESGEDEDSNWDTDHAERHSTGLAFGEDEDDYDDFESESDGPALRLVESIVHRSVYFFFGLAPLGVVAYFIHRYRRHASPRRMPSGHALESDESEYVSGKTKPLMDAFDLKSQLDSEVGVIPLLPVPPSAHAQAHALKNPLTPSKSIAGNRLLQSHGQYMPPLAADGGPQVQGGRGSGSSGHLYGSGRSPKVQ